MTIGERMAWARERRDLTQDALAVLAGTSQGTIGNAESGARKKPRELLKIAEALRVSPKWLERGEGPWEVSKATLAPATANAPADPADVLMSSLQVVTGAIEKTDKATRASVLPLFSFIGEVGFPSGNIATRIFTLINGASPAMPAPSPKKATRTIGLEPEETSPGIQPHGLGSRVQKKSNEK